MPSNATQIRPSAIRNASLPKSLRGFDENATRKLLGEVAAVVESLTAERENLRRQVETLQAANSYEPTEAALEPAESPEALGSAILAAKRAGEELIAAAQEEANRILAAAAAEAERLAEDARASMNDAERELAQDRATLERQRADHERTVSEWSANVEAEREETVLRARAEAESLLAAHEDRVSELRQEADEVSRLISDRKVQFIAMLQAALAELEPLVNGDGGAEPSEDDLPRALKASVESAAGSHGG